MNRVSKKPSYLFTQCRNIAREVRFGNRAKALLLNGVDLLADAVAVTLGPRGRYVVLEQPFGPPKITKDGVTVAKSIELKGKFENIGAQLARNVAVKTSEKSGDGTSTATILARSIARNGFECISRGSNPFEIRKGVNMAVEAVQRNLENVSTPIKTPEDVEKVAILSANGDCSIGKLIQSVIVSVGKDGVIAINSGTKLEHEIEIVEGIKIDQGYVSPFFINTHKGSKVHFADSLVLISQKKIFYARQIIPAIEICQLERKPLIVIAEDFDSEVLSILILNKVKNGLPVVAIKAPGFGDDRKETLLDIAIATGAVLFEDDSNLVRLEDCLSTSLGKVREVSVSKKSTVLLGASGSSEDIMHRIALINTQLAKAEKEIDKRNLIARISRLKGKIAVLHIGGTNEIEVNEIKDRVRNALNATRAAIEEGVVPGGGTAYLRCIPKLCRLKCENQDQKNGIEIVKSALEMPCKTIAYNAGLAGSCVVLKVQNLPHDYGFDVYNNKYVNLMMKGISDPTKVLNRALVDASGIASLLTTAEAIICEHITRKKMSHKEKIKQYSL